MSRFLDVDDFPLGSRVITPMGRIGVVIAHKGAESKRDAHERCVVRYEDGGGRDRATVSLLPHLLVKCPTLPAMDQRMTQLSLWV